MTDSMMVEKVAKAILINYDDVDQEWVARNWTLTEAHCGDCTNMPFTCMRCVCEDAMKAARAAITALMGPSDAMVDAGSIACDALCKSQTGCHLDAIFEAMLTTALEEG